MKKITRWQTYVAVTAVAALVLMAGCADGADRSGTPLEPNLTPPLEVSLASVDPMLYPGDRAGNSAFECSQLSVSYEYACKIDGWDDNDMNGQYICPLSPWDGDTGYNEITISNSDGTYFDWAAVNAIGAVIVKGGSMANVFYYDPQAHSDTRLFSPTNPSGKPAGVSHVTFCWNPENGCEWKGETAWSAGSRYVTRGNWATYTTAQVTDNTVTLYAGQTKDAGTAHFSAAANGMVTITITLNSGWRFADVEENVKIQDYASAPTGNPNPGGFAHKGKATESPFSIQVPANNFYGVHLDVEWEKCD